MNLGHAKSSLLQVGTRLALLQCLEDLSNMVEVLFLTLAEDQDVIQMSWWRVSIYHPSASWRLWGLSWTRKAWPSIRKGTPWIWRESFIHQRVWMVTGDIQNSSQYCWNIWPHSTGLEGHWYVGLDTYYGQWSCSVPDSQYIVSRCLPSSVPTLSSSHNVRRLAWCALSAIALESSYWFHCPPKQSVGVSVHLTV